MAGSGRQDVQDLGLKQVWTFHITSGPQISVGLPDNPSLDYPGHGQLFWKIVASEAIAQAYFKGLTDLGVQVRLLTEEMTEEMRREKAALQGRPDSQ